MAKGIQELIDDFKVLHPNAYNRIRNNAIDEFYDKVLNFEDYIDPVDDDNGILLYSGSDITKMIVNIANELRSIK